MKVGIFNGTIATTNGIYKISDIDIEDAKKLLCENGFISAIGHEATAEAVSDEFNMDIPMNRINFIQEVGQKAIVFKLNERPAEGCILSRDEIEAIGYSFKLMERLE
jgi:hypothetical protein